jgi:simple sugar transport system permease protein
LIATDILVAIVAATVRQASILLCGAAGEVISERSGVLNLELEGMMMAGSFTGFYIAYTTGNLWLAIVLGILVGGVIGCGMALLTEKRKIDQIIAGFTLLFLGTGVANYLYDTFFSSNPYATAVKFSGIDVRGLSDLPILGPALFQQPAPIYLPFIIIVIVWFVIKKTSVGLRLRSCGEDPVVAASLGINVTRTRSFAIVATGLLAGLAGALFTPVFYTRWEINMTGGRGWIAIALVYFGKWSPIPILLGSLLFGLIDASQLYLKFSAPWLPQELFSMLPYIAAIAVLIPISKKGGAPRALGTVHKEAA